MDIYVVLEVDSDGDSRNLGAFSSQENADKFIDERKVQVSQLFEGSDFNQYIDIFELNSWDEADS